MSLASSVLHICFLCNHLGPKAHFEAYETCFRSHNIQCTWITNQTDLTTIDFSTFDCAMVALGDPDSKELLDRFPQHVIEIGLWETPRPKVTQDYDALAYEVMRKIDMIFFFANRHLVSEFNEFPQEKKWGVGFSPTLEKVDKIKDLRTQQARRDFLNKHGLEDRGQKIATYFGGASSEHKQAFAHFLTLLDDAPEDYLFVYQRHPRDTTDWNFNDSVIASQVSFDEACAACDLALYYQTSTDALLASIVPTIQVTSASSKEDFLNELRSPPPILKKEELSDRLGTQEDWQSRLINRVIDLKSHRH